MDRKQLEYMAGVKRRRLNNAAKAELASAKAIYDLARTKYLETITSIETEYAEEMKAAIVTP